MTVDLARAAPRGDRGRRRAGARAARRRRRPTRRVALLRGIVHRAVTKHGDESELTGMAQSRLADMLRRTGAPEAEQLGALTDAIKAFSASVGPTDPQTTSAFGRLAHVALAAQAVEIAVTAGHAGDRRAAGARRGRDADRRRHLRRARDGRRRAPLARGAGRRRARATASRRTPAATTPTGAARSPPGARSASRAGSPITEELSLVAFGTPPALVVELDHVAPDGALDQHNHGFALRRARAPCASGSPRRRSPGARRRAASRSSAAPATAPPCASRRTSRSRSTPPSSTRLRAALAEALSGSGGDARARPQRPVPVRLGPQVQALLRQLTRRHS